MERNVEIYGETVFLDGICIHAKKSKWIGDRINEFNLLNTISKKPKYYLCKEDNMLLEIWFNITGTCIDTGLNKIKEFKDKFSTQWNLDICKEITYEEAMKILSEKGETKQNESTYTYKGLMDKGVEQSEVLAIGQHDDFLDGLKYGMFIGVDYAKGEPENSVTKEQNNGGSSDWYKLPDNANTLQDLIEHRNMNGSIKDIFKACYRAGIKEEDTLRDANKMAYYALREVGRLTNRRDYVTIAKELMGSQAIEKD